MQAFCRKQENLELNRVGVVERFTREEFDRYERNCRPHTDGSDTSGLTSFFLSRGASKTGFIGPNQPLKAVVEWDDRDVRRLLGEHGHEMIALKLLQVCGNRQFDGMKKLQFSPDQFSVKGVEYMGYQACPFWKADDHAPGGGLACCGTGAGDYTIVNENTGKRIVMSDLMPHLILFHHFYEGTVPHRTSPKHLIDVLEVEASDFEGTDWGFVQRDAAGCIVGIGDESLTQIWEYEPPRKEPVVYEWDTWEYYIPEPDQARELERMMPFLQTGNPNFDDDPELEKQNGEAE